MAFLTFLIGYLSRGPVPLKQGQQFEGLKHRLDTLEETPYEFLAYTNVSRTITHEGEVRRL